MRDRSGVMSLSIIGMIIVAFTLTAFFLLGIERTTLNIWASAFLLLSEAVLFCGLIGLRYANTDYNRAFFKAGITTSLFLYAMVTLVSVLFARGFSDNLNAFILMELAIIAFFTIIMISVFAFSRGIERRNKEDITKIGTTEAKRGGF